jgi:hypothetical protein
MSKILRFDTEEEFRNFQAGRNITKKETRPKYGNKKVEIDGVLFDSKKESNRYLILKQWQASGQINHLEWHKPFAIIVNNIHIGDYEADFVYYDKRRMTQVVEDVKSGPTRRRDIYRWKKKLMKALHGIEIVEI